MSLADVMAGAGLHGFAEIGLLVCLGAFAAIAARIFLRRNREAFDRARHLPLEDDDE